MASLPSQMNIGQRREFSRTHEPEWVSKGLAKKMKSPLHEGVTAFAKGFGIAFVGKFAIGLIFSLMGKRKNFSAVLKEIFGRDTLRFALFYGTWNGLFRASNGLLFKHRGKGIKDDRMNAALAAIIAGFALLIDEEERRRSIAVYVFVRALSVMVKGLSREGKLPYWEHAESLGFGIVNAPIMYGFLLEPEILDQNYYRWILNMGAVTHDGF